VISSWTIRASAAAVSRPFLLGFVREGLGIRLLFNCYIASSLERELRDTHTVDVIECAAGAERRYTVSLQHAFD
jgi:hypothetical protein